MAARLVAGAAFKRASSCTRTPSLASWAASAAVIESFKLLCAPNTVSAVSFIASKGCFATATAVHTTWSATSSGLAAARWRTPRFDTTSLAIAASTAA